MEEDMGKYLFTSVLSTYLITSVVINLVPCFVIIIRLLLLAILMILHLENIMYIDYILTETSALIIVQEI